MGTWYFEDMKNTAEHVITILFIAVQQDLYRASTRAMLYNFRLISRPYTALIISFNTVYLSEYNSQVIRNSKIHNQGEIIVAIPI